MKRFHDILFINKLVIMAVVGIYKWESQCLQKLIFDLQLRYAADIVKGDKHVLNYIDYIQVSQMIQKIIYGKRFFLIEDVAEIIARTLLKNFDIFYICVTVSKPDAIREASNVGICIKRTKNCI